MGSWLSILKPQNGPWMPSRPVWPESICLISPAVLRQSLSSRSARKKSWISRSRGLSRSQSRCAGIDLMDNAAPSTGFDWLAPWLSAMTGAALDQFNDRPVKSRFRSTERCGHPAHRQHRSCAPCRRLRRPQLRAERCPRVSVVIRNGILFRSHVHRETSIGGHFQGHHPLIAHHGVGGPHGAGD